MVSEIKKATRRRFSAEEKIRVILEGLRGMIPVTELCRREGIPAAAYYRWRRKYRDEGLMVRSPLPAYSWNKLLDEEADKILEIADLHPDWPSRQIAHYISDHCGFTVSKATVFRVLKRKDLISSRTVKTFPASSEYKVKTKRVNEQWQIDETYMFVKGWGFPSDLELGIKIYIDYYNQERYPVIRIVIMKHWEM
ncbi:transposase [bacterium]|nr:transposase [bacterium]